MYPFFSVCYSRVPAPRETHALRCSRLAQARRRQATGAPCLVASAGQVQEAGRWCPPGGTVRQSVNIRLLHPNTLPRGFIHPLLSHLFPIHLSINLITSYFHWIILLEFNVIFVFLLLLLFIILIIITGFYSCYYHPSSIFFAPCAHVLCSAAHSSVSWCVRRVSHVHT